MAETAQDSTVELLALSPVQVRILRQLGDRRVNDILNLDFNEPEHDTLRIRQHAFLKGYLEALGNILRFDAEQMELAKQQLSSAIDRTNTPTSQGF
jgi:hypothetical protein